ncbi:MAG TPA: DNA-binding protein [Stellaceae bacterium]|jgi:hypothetical protein|nr:DNA-binding protein [Stellaceae bacterium]
MSMTPAPAADLPPGAYSPADFERAFGIAHSTFYEIVKSGDLIVRKMGRRTFVLHEDAAAWARSLPIGIGASKAA